MVVGQGGLGAILSIVPLVDLNWDFWKISETRCITCKQGPGKNINETSQLSERHSVQTQAFTNKKLAG